MFRKLVMTFLLLSFSCFGLMSFAGGKNVVESDLPYVDGKVNDPVSKSARTAYIFTENPTLSLNLSEGQKVEIVSYCNSYLKSEDRGIRNRLMKKTLTDHRRKVYASSRGRVPGGERGR